MVGRTERRALSGIGSLLTGLGAGLAQQQAQKRLQTQQLMLAVLGQAAQKGIDPSLDPNLAKFLKGLGPDVGAAYSALARASQPAAPMDLSALLGGGGTRPTRRDVPVDILGGVPSSIAAPSLLDAPATARQTEVPPATSITQTAEGGVSVTRRTQQPSTEAQQSDALDAFRRLLVQRTDGGLPNDADIRAVIRGMRDADPPFAISGATEKLIRQQVAADIHAFLVEKGVAGSPEAAAYARRVAKQIPDDLKEAANVEVSRDRARRIAKDAAAIRLAERSQAIGSGLRTREAFADTPLAQEALLSGVDIPGLTGPPDPAQVSQLRRDVIAQDVESRIAVLTAQDSVRERKRLEQAKAQLGVIAENLDYLTTPGDDGTSLIQRVNTAKQPGLLPILAQGARNLYLSQLERDPDVRIYDALTKAMASLIIKGQFGEAGNLSRSDVQRAMAIVPSIFDGEELAMRKVRLLERVLDSNIQLGEAGLMALLRSPEAIEVAGQSAPTMRAIHFNLGAFRETFPEGSLDAARANRVFQFDEVDVIPSTMPGEASEAIFESFIGGGGP